jgi:hypothetical protein
VSLAPDDARARHLADGVLAMLARLQVRPS